MPGALCPLWRFRSSRSPTPSSSQRRERISRQRYRDRVLPRLGGLPLTFGRVGPAPSAQVGLRQATGIGDVLTLNSSADFDSLSVRCSVTTRPSESSVIAPHPYHVRHSLCTKSTTAGHREAEPLTIPVNRASTHHHTEDELPSYASRPKSTCRRSLSHADDTGRNRLSRRYNQGSSRRIFPHSRSCVGSG